MEDCARGILQAALRYDGADPVNLGTAQETTIRDLVSQVARSCDYGGEILWDSTRPDGQPRRCLNTDAAWEGFGFRASTPLEVGLRRTIEGYRETQAGSLPL